LSLGIEPTAFRKNSTFDEYIKTLPVYEKLMIMHVEFVPGGEDMLKHCLENNRSLKIGTDGSVNL
jgi:hypothetical protein